MELRADVRDGNFATKGKFAVHLVVGTRILTTALRYGWQAGAPGNT